MGSSYMQRVVRLHRFYAFRSFKEPQFIASRHAAIDAARQITRAHRQIFDSYVPHPLVANVRPYCPLLPKLAD